MKRNVVLTVAAGYGLDTIEPFLASWAEHVPDAELVVFAKDNDEAFYSATARLGVTVLDCAPPRSYAILGARHFLYRDYLRANRRNFDAVLLSDCRDVVFQGDPFAVPRDAPVSFAAEDAPFSQCVMNRLWLWKVYEASIVDPLQHETISCAGTTIGTTDGILDYLNLMCLELDSRSEGIENHGDQGMHNYILYRLRPAFATLDREDRIVATVGHTDPERIAVADGRLTVDGRVSPVVHQWDRRAPSREHVLARYRLEPPAG